MLLETLRAPYQTSLAVEQRCSGTEGATIAATGTIATTAEPPRLAEVQAEPTAAAILTMDTTVATTEAVASTTTATAAAAAAAAAAATVAATVAAGIASVVAATAAVGVAVAAGASAQ